MLVLVSNISYNQDMLDEYKKAAAQLIPLKSVSADPSCKDDIKKTAEWFVNYLPEAGFDAQLFEGYANPIVFGTYVVDPSFETALIYGHYDVQPASREDGWDTDPFTLVEKNGKLFGRGIMDDKCQLLLHVIAISQLIKDKKLGYNIKFIFEGNEEVGSPAIENFIKEHKDLLACDFVMISDGEMTMGKPTIELGNRGVINTTLTIKTAHNDLHSGLYGGIAPNAVHELSAFIANLHDAENKITIPGFYDDVAVVDKSITLPFSMEDYTKNTGAKVLKTEKDMDFYAQAGQRPSIEVTGIQAGYTGEGYRNSIPRLAMAKINMRLVKNQNPEKIQELFKKYVKQVLPAYVDYDLSFEEGTFPVRISADNKFVEKAEEVLEKICGEKPVHRYVGGTEPVVVFFDQILDVPQVMVPFANEDGAMHGINENFNITNIEKGLEFSETFFSK